MASKTEISFALRAINEASKTLKDVERDIGDLGKTADDSGGKLEGFGSKAGGALGNIASIAGGFVVAEGLMKMPGFLMDAAKAAAEDEAATMRLNKSLENLLKSTGDFGEVEMGELQNAMNGLIESGQKLAFSDDDVRDSMQSLIASTGDYGEAAKRHAAAMDLARGAGIPLSQATKMLGKMTEDNVEVFKRMGITIGENATEAEALAAVQEKFGGQADAYAKSTAGQFEIANLKMAEAKETIGTALMPAMAAMADVLATKVMPAVESFAGSFATLPSVIGPHLDALDAVVSKNFAKFKVYYDSDIKPALDNIVAAVEAAVGFIKDHWDKIGPIIEAPLKNAQTMMELWGKIIGNVFQIIIDLIQGDWAGAWKNFEDIVRAAKEAAIESMHTLFDALKGLGGLAWEAMEFLGDQLMDGLKAALSSTAGFAGDVAQAVLDAVKSLVNTYVIDPINSALQFKIPVPGLPDININPPDIPRLAGGGIVSQPTLAVVGEGGESEAVIPLSKLGPAIADPIVRAFNGVILPTLADMMAEAMARAGTMAYVAGANGLLPGQNYGEMTGYTPYYTGKGSGGKGVGVVNGNDYPIPFGEMANGAPVVGFDEVKAQIMAASGRVPTDEEVQRVMAGMLDQDMMALAFGASDYLGGSYLDYHMGRQLLGVKGSLGQYGHGTVARGAAVPAHGGRGGNVVNLHFHGFVGDIHALKRELGRAGVMVGA